MSISLSAIIADPLKTAEVPTDAIPSLLTQLAAVQSALAARLISGPALGSVQRTMPEADTLLTAEEAAPLLSVTPHWLYRHWKQLPFSRRLSRKVLRFSEIGLRKWQAVKRT